MKNSKRIHAVTIKRMSDTDPDTSYLGEYSDRAKSDYAIDRRHSIDCASQEFNHSEIVERLERVLSYVSACTYSEGLTDSEREDLSETQDVIVEVQNGAQECDCGEHGDMERNEYRYFNGVVENYKGETPEKIREYVRRDYERMERLHHGDWCYIGVRAEAEILIPSGSASVMQEITSGGLWGVESDSDTAYLTEIETDELAELREQLHALGFSKRAVSTAVKNAQHENA